MCSPNAYMSLSTGMSVMSSVQQGDAANAAGQTQGEKIDYQARVSRDDALAQAQLIRRNQRYLVGASDAAAAASGVVVGSGSAGEVNRKILQDTEHDAYMAILNGERRATAQEFEADQARTAGKNARRNAYLSAAGTALGSGYKNSKWKTASKNSLIPSSEIPMQAGGGY